MTLSHPRVPRRRLRRTSYTRLLRAVNEFAASRRPLPDLPLPQVPDRAVLKRYTPQEREAIPGLHARLILHDCLTGRRGEASARSYHIFDQLPLGVRQLVNDNNDCNWLFARHWREMQPAALARLIRSAIRNGRAVVNLADL